MRERKRERKKASGQRRNREEKRERKGEKQTVLVNQSGCRLNSNFRLFINTTTRGRDRGEREYVIERESEKALRSTLCHGPNQC